MKKILLVSNYVFHYRMNNYNYFYEEFLKLGYEFQVLTESAQTVDFPIRFKLTVKKQNPFSYYQFIRKLNPDVVITFLHLKDYILFFVNFFCKAMGIPLIYWNFGINIFTPDTRFKNALYYHVHNISDAIILYSPAEKIYIRKKNHHKLFVANNTLNLTVLDRAQFSDKDYLKNKYGVKENHVILFIGRINRSKDLDSLLECFRDEKCALVIVGKGIREDQLEIVKNTPNYYYLGEIYNFNEVGSIFFCSDVFSIPGNIGLALIEALFWGKPVVTYSGVNTPEIYYLKDGYNGYIVNNKAELKKKILDLFKYPEKYNQLSANARSTYENQAHIKYMFKGFIEAVNFVLK